MFDAVFIGLSVGSIMLLVALGLAITYGAMGVINMAHGEMVMLGAYTAVMAKIWLGLGLLASIPLAFIVSASAGLLIERVIVARLYGRLLDTLLATWGVAILLQQAIRLSFGLAFFGITIQGLGTDLRTVQTPEFLHGVIAVGSYEFNAYRTFVIAFTDEFNAYRTFVIAFTVIVTVVTWWIMYKTSLGMRVRAIMRNPDMASACGIDVARVNALTFAYGSGLAGIAGVMIAGLESVFPDMGTPKVVEAFLVVVTGGVGSLGGTVLAAGILGQITGIASALTNDILARAIVFGIVILIIIWKPKGLFSYRGR